MISVVMPTYNCATFIKQSINSILNQTYKDFEFLIIDDGSTDNTEEIVLSFSDSRIVYKRIEHSGLSKALNIGLNCASNEIVARMDADDISHPLRFERQLLSSSRESNEIIFSDAAFFAKNKILFTILNINESNYINYKLSLHGHFTHPSVIYHRSHILGLGGYNESLNIYEDYDLWLRIKDRSKFIFVNEILQFQRIRDGSLTKINSKNLNDKLYEIQKPYFIDLTSSFGISEVDEQNKAKGWREYFYGGKNLARAYWLNVKMNNWDYRMFLAFLISYLPETFAKYIKSLRLRLRLEYIINQNKKYRGLAEEFKKILLEVEK